MLRVKFSYTIHNNSSNIVLVTSDPTLTLPLNQYLILCQFHHLPHFDELDALQVLDHVAPHYADNRYKMNLKITLSNTVDQELVFDVKIFGQFKQHQFVRIL